LVSKGGILLGEYPKSELENEKVLASGLLAALLSFSKEVHKSDLESLSFHDRIVTFIKIDENFLVVEFSSVVQTDVIEKMIIEIKKIIEPLIDSIGDLSGDYSLVEELLQTIGNLNWYHEALNKLGFTQPLVDKEISTFRIQHTGSSDMVITNENNNLISQVANLLNQYRRTKNYEMGLIKSFIPCPNQDFSLYVLADLKTSQSEVNFLKLPNEMNLDMFRLTPYLNSEVDHIKVEKSNSLEILQEIIKVHDIGKLNISDDKLENVSFDYLDKIIKKKLDIVLNSIVIGQPILVVGDRPSVRIVTNTLSLFSQHRSTEIIEWLDLDNEVGNNITGISISKYKEMEKEGKINSNITIIELDSRKVIGSDSNRYLPTLFDQVKKQEPKHAAQMIKNELDALVLHALKITEMIFLEKELAIQNLSTLQKEINNQYKFDLILNMAKQRNQLLDLIITELSSSLKTAENFLSNF